MGYWRVFVEKGCYFFTVVVVGRVSDSVTRHSGEMIINVGLRYLALLTKLTRLTVI